MFNINIFKPYIYIHNYFFIVKKFHYINILIYFIFFTNACIMIYIYLHINNIIFCDYVFQWYLYRYFFFFNKYKYIIKMTKEWNLFFVYWKKFKNQIYLSYFVNFCFFLIFCNDKWTFLYWSLILWLLFIKFTKFSIINIFTIFTKINSSLFFFSIWISSFFLSYYNSNCSLNIFVLFLDDFGYFPLFIELISFLILFYSF